jgi:hypothetical protein
MPRAVEAYVQLEHRGVCQPVGDDARSRVGEDRRVVFGFTPMDRCHGEGVSAPTGKPLAGAQVGEPRPGDQAFDGDAKSVPIGGDSLEKRLRVRVQVAMARTLAVLVKETGRHRPSRPVAATIKLVRRRVASPEVASS